MSSLLDHRKLNPDGQELGHRLHIELGRGTGTIMKVSELSMSTVGVVGERNFQSISTGLSFMVEAAVKFTLRRN